MKSFTNIPEIQQPDGNELLMARNNACMVCEHDTEYHAPTGEGQRLECRARDCKCGFYVPPKGSPAGLAQWLVWILNQVPTSRMEPSDIAILYQAILACSKNKDVITMEEAPYSLLKKLWTDKEFGKKITMVKDREGKSIEVIDSAWATSMFRWVLAMQILAAIEDVLPQKE